MKPWTIDEAIRTYHIDRWGNGYFGVSQRGHLLIQPEQGKSEGAIDLMAVIDEIRRQDIELPVVIRFQDCLRAQVNNLCQTFQTVMKNEGYKGNYTGVFPIKVNQMREVVEEILEAGEPYNFGLESGSKPELLAALAMNTNPEALTIVNGYKDRDYLKLALMGRKLGRKVIVVIEKLNELQDLLDLANEMNVEPMIGFRAKLASKGSGKWADSGGDKAKFGLTVAEIMQSIYLLKARGKMPCVKLFHFHIGSQITDIRTIKDALMEGARIYAGLVKQGLNMAYFDVGGGLGVDYIGSKSDDQSSVNYTLQDYVEDVVLILKQVCDAEKIAHPDIVSESGRMITAYHSCVITEVFDKRKTVKTDYDTTPVETEHMLVSNMRQILASIDAKYFQEAYHDAAQIKNDAIQGFKLGVLSLDERAKVETLFWQICVKLKDLEDRVEYVPEELQALDDELAEQYFCNFSIFQSVPDTWAIDQVLPIVPICRLNQRPTVLCTLADITCDSDGKIDLFVDVPHTRHALPLHDLTKDPYYIGIFLTGAYQDVMGDLHNLFGRLNEVHIYAEDSDSSGFYIEEYILGNRADQVLTSMQYNPQSMALDIKKMLAAQVKKKELPPRESVMLANFYERCLRSYTYLNIH